MMFKISNTLKSTILTTAIEEAPCIREANWVVLQCQQENRKKKEEIKLGKKIDKLTDEYVKAVVYRKMYDSDWKSIANVDNELKTLTSARQKLEAVKDDIRTCIKGCDFKQHPIIWSKDGKKTPLSTLISHFKTIIGEEDLNKIPDNPWTIAE